MALISKEELEEMYWGEPGTELGAPTIAKKIGCAKSTVYTYMKRYGIETRPPCKNGNAECFTNNTRSQLKENAIEMVENGVLGLAGENHPNYNKHWSKEVRKRMSESKKGKYKGEKNHFYGKQHTKKTKEKISKANKGNKMPKDAKKRMKSKLEGEKNWNSISKNKAIEIYYLYRNKNISKSKLAEKNNISYDTVQRITRGEHFATEHLEPIIKTNKYLRGSKNPASKIDKKTGVEIFKEYKENNISYKELAKKYDVSESSIGNIARGQHWTTKSKKPIEKNVTKKQALGIYNKYKNNNIKLKDLAKEYDFSIQVINTITRAKHKFTKNLEPISKVGGAKGLKNPKSKLDKKTAIKIYNEYKNLETNYNLLGNKYNLSTSTINRVVNCRHWTTKHLKDD
jgi:Mor family transcriptional regulator